MRSDRERLQDILEAIERIERHANQGRELFEKDELVQIWMVHHFQIIGEAASRISENLVGSHPEVPWPQMVAMRNVLVHDYFGVDVDEVWNTVANDLPPLKAAITAILESV